MQSTRKEQSNEKFKEVTNQLKDLEKSNARLLDAVRGITRPRSKKLGLSALCNIKDDRKKVEHDAKIALSFTETENFKPVSVKLLNKDTKELMDVDWNEATVSSMHKKDEKSLVKKTLYIKDRYNISDVSYHELAMINGELPRISTVTKVMKELNTKYTLYPTTGKAVAVQQFFKERLGVQIHCLLKLNPSCALDRHICVKITGDDTVVSCSLYLVARVYNVEESI